MLKHTKKMWKRYRNPSPKCVEYNHLHKAWVIAEFTVVSEKHRKKNATLSLSAFLFCSVIPKHVAKILKISVMMSPTRNNRGMK